MGKLTDDQLRFIIDIEATGAQGQINTLNAEIGKLEKQNASLSSSLSKVNNELTKQEKKLAKMEAAGKTNTAAYRQLAQAVETNRQKQAQLSTQLKQTQNALDKDREKVAQFTSTLKLNQMTMQQLRDRAAMLRKQLDVTSKAASPETFKRLSNELAKTEAQMGKLGKKTSMVGDVFKGVFGAGMAIKGAKMLLQTIGNGIGTITSFEAANASLAAVLGTTQDGVQRLTADAKRLGEITEYSASQVTMMQTELAKLGFNETEILQSTQSILQFATATGSDIPEAAQLAGAALRAFGLDASEMTRVVSAMGVATTKSALDFSYLQNSMSTIAPVANAFGFTIEDTTALLGTLANSGFDASSAATATRNILLNLADSSGKLAQALGKPIKSLDDLAPALQELKDQGVSLAEALDLTDKRSVAAFETFLNGADAITTLRDSITGVGDDLAAMQQTKLDTVEGSFKLMQSAWEGLMLQFYNSKGVFKDIVDLTTKIIGGMRNAVKWVQDNAKAVKIITGVLATYLVTGKAITLWRKADMAAMIAEMTTKIANIGVTKLAEQANESLKRSLMTSPWGLIALAITAVIAGLVLFVKHAMEASDAQSVLNETQERAQDLAKGQIADANAEKAALNNLVKSIMDTNDNERLRADLINQLESQYPEFLAHLDKEKVTNEQLHAALLNANDAYNDRIRLLKAEALAEAYKESIVEMNKKLIEQEIALSNTDSERKQEKLRKEITETQKAIDKLSSSYNDAMSSLETARIEEDKNNSLEGLKRKLAGWERAAQQVRDNIKSNTHWSEEEIKYQQNLLTGYEQRASDLRLRIAAKEAEANKEQAKANQEAAQRQSEVNEEAYKKQLKALQDSYAARKAEIIRQEAEMQITAEQSKQKQLELTLEQAKAELDFATKHGKATADLQIKVLNAQMALNKNSYTTMQKDLQTWLDDSLRADKQALLNREMTQEEYDAHTRELQTQHLDKLKALMEQYGMDTSDIDKKIADNQIKNQEEANKAILKAAKKARTEALKAAELAEQQELETLERRYNLGLISETQYHQQRNKITETYALARVAAEKIYAEAVKDLDAEVVAEANAAVTDATKALNQALQDRLSEAREFTSELRDILTETAEACGDTLGGQLLGSFANAMDAIQQFQAQSEAGFANVGQAIQAHVQMIGSVMSQALQAASQLTSQIFEMEANQLEAAKQKELAAVGDNAEEKERIEQEYAQKELDLKKKQADADAAIQSASLWVNTAMGIATAWATSMQLGPIAGPIMAAVLTAALLATAGIQQANIIAQRDAIKNQTLESSGGSSAGINDSTASVSTTSIRDEYKPGGQGYSDGGYTGDGGVHEPAGVVHKGEYVVSQAELKNPAVVSMVRSIEGVRQSRKHGRTGEHGFADGGYTSDAPSTGELTETLAELRDEIRLLRTEKIHAELNYQEFKEVKSKMENLEKKGKL